MVWTAPADALIKGLAAAGAEGRPLLSWAGFPHAQALFLKRQLSLPVSRM